MILTATKTRFTFSSFRYVEFWMPPVLSSVLKTCHPRCSMPQATKKHPWHSTTEAQKLRCGLASLDFVAKSSHDWSISAGDEFYRFDNALRTQLLRSNTHLYEFRISISLSECQRVKRHIQGTKESPIFQNTYRDPGNPKQSGVTH